MVFVKTMRQPSKYSIGGTPTASLNRLKNAEQEKAAFNAGIGLIGLIGLIGALEGTSMETARQIVETNTIGTLAVTQGVSPQFGVATEASS